MQYWNSTATRWRLLFSRYLNRLDGTGMRPVPSGDQRGRQQREAWGDENCPSARARPAGPIGANGL
jgi:hypothetical protein